jgi:hypothetical protein
VLRSSELKKVNVSIHLVRRTWFEDADELILQTTEITRLQIGEDPEDVRLLVTTLSEAENLLPLLIEYQQKGQQVNVVKYVPKMFLKF